jgi:hypothetical protein
MSAPGAAYAGVQPPLAAPLLLPPAAGGALPRVVDAVEPSGSPGQGQPPGQRLGSVAGGSGGLAPTPRAPGEQDSPSLAPGGSAAPTPGGSPSSPNMVPSGSLGQGTGVEAGGAHGGAPPPRAPGVQELALSAPGGPAAMPSRTSAPAALPQSTSPPAPSGTASPPSPLPAPAPGPCPICQEPMDGPTGYTTTPCGHQLCTQCFVTTAATNSVGDTFPCPFCRCPLGDPHPGATALVNSPERTAWDQAMLEIESLELAHALLAESLDQAPAEHFPFALGPASSPSPSLVPLPFSPAPVPGLAPVPTSVPGVSVPPFATPQPMPAAAPASSGASSDRDPSAAAGTARASSGPWRSQRANFGRQPEQPFWISNPAARRSNDGSRSSSVAPSRSGRHRSRSSSPPARRPPAFSSFTPAMPGPGPSLRPTYDWGSGIRRSPSPLDWGSGVSQPSPSLPPPSSRGGQGRW